MRQLFIVSFVDRDENGKILSCGPVVAIPYRLEDGLMPSERLRIYAKKYAMDYSKLSWAIVNEIPPITEKDKE